MTRVLSTALCAVVLLAAAFDGAAQDKKPQTPATIAGGKVITADEAKKLLDGRKAAFFDTRSAVNFGKGHVPGAKAIPYGEKSEFAENFDAAVDRFDVSKLPADRNGALVFYSDGPTGWKSYKAAVLAIRAGYKSVHYLRGGWAEWESRKHPVEN
jgi:3-mercaptopyruvate sulfurtransferase SseA